MTMLHVECPWCAGTATVELADGDQFSCAGCAIRVDLAPDAATVDPIVAALAA